jgi:hypothetical protein
MTDPDRRFPVLVALLAPAVRLLTRSRWVSRALATAVVVVGGLAVLGGVLYGLVVAFLAGLPAFQVQLGQSFSQIRDWLARSPLRSSGASLDSGELPMAMRRRPPRWHFSTSGMQGIGSLDGVLEGWTVRGQRVTSPRQVLKRCGYDDELWTSPMDVTGV